MPCNSIPFISRILPLPLQQPPPEKKKIERKKKRKIRVGGDLVLETVV